MYANKQQKVGFSFHVMGFFCRAYRETHRSILYDNDCHRGFLVVPFVMQVYAHSGAYTCFLLHRKEYVTKTGGIDMTTETKFWKKKYFTMLAGQSVSLITSGILQMSIIFYLTAKTNSAMVLSIATLMGFLPQAVIGPFAGTFVDRHSRKGVMIGADLMIAATGGFLAVVSIFMELPIWLIMLVLFVRSIGNAFHSPASSAVTPLMVPQDQLTKCAGYNQTMQAAVSLISPAAAAFLYSVWSLSTIILLDIIGAVLACGVVVVLSIPNPPICTGESQNSFFRDMKEGYFELKKNKGLFALLWIGTAYMFFFMPISALYPLMSMGYFRGTPTHASIAEIAFAGGMLAGGILLSVWGGFKNRIFFNRSIGSCDGGKHCDFRFCCPPMRFFDICNLLYGHGVNFSIFTEYKTPCFKSSFHRNIWDGFSHCSEA